MDDKFKGNPLYYINYDLRIPQYWNCCWLDWSNDCRSRALWAFLIVLFQRVRSPDCFHRSFGSLVRIESEAVETLPTILLKIDPNLVSVWWRICRWHILQGMQDSTHRRNNPRNLRRRTRSHINCLPSLWLVENSAKYNINAYPGPVINWKIPDDQVNLLR